MQLRSLARNLRHMWLSSLIIFVIASVVIGAVHFATSKPSYQVEGDVVFTSKAVSYTHLTLPTIYSV